MNCRSETGHLICLPCAVANDGVAMQRVKAALVTEPGLDPPANGQIESREAAIRRADRKWVIYREEGMKCPLDNTRATLWLPYEDPELGAV